MRTYFWILEDYQGIQRIDSVWLVRSVPCLSNYGLLKDHFGCGSYDLVWNCFECFGSCGLNEYILEFDFINGACSGKYDCYSCFDLRLCFETLGQSLSALLDGLEKSKVKSLTKLVGTDGFFDANALIEFLLKPIDSSTSLHNSVI